MLVVIDQRVVYVIKSDISKRVQEFIVLEGEGEGTIGWDMDGSGLSWDCFAKFGFSKRLF